MLTEDAGLRRVQKETLLAEDADVKEFGGRVLKEEYDGRYFRVTDNTARSSKSDAGIEKRIVSEIIGKSRKWHFILDAYAGFGISAYIFSKIRREWLQ